MKILLINVTYGIGSTGAIVKSLYNGYKTFNHEVKVIYGRRTTIKDKDNIEKCTFEVESKIHHFLSLFTGNMYGGMFFSTRKIIRKIKKYNPDVVHLHCLNGYFVNIYKLMYFLSSTGKKVILTMHADFMMTGGCGYSVDCKKYLDSECRNCSRYKQFNSLFSLNKTHLQFLKMRKCINCFGKNNLIITCVSPWLTNRYTQSPIYNKFKISTVLNPVEINLNLNNEKSPFPTKEKNILYVTANIYDNEKSGWLIEDVAARLKNYNFTIINGSSTDYVSTLENVTVINRLSHNELPKYYKNADATLLLSKRETFSMIVAESLLYGTPVVGFKSGGPESIAIKDYSIFCDYGNIDELCGKIPLIISKKDKSDLISKSAKEKFDVLKISSNYLKLLS